MATALSSHLATGKGSAFTPKLLPTPLFTFHSHRRGLTSLKRTKIYANIGGGDGELKQGGKKKFITREEEPEQYWQTAGERKGANPMMTPLPYIIIFGMSTPFVILAIAFANGWIKVPVR
ncbi:transmembrane protein [Rhynchospora pubera]|uniref:Transmembrane protein n=1 Tax=Rhynchospora pubera TaxID=906938 RepID=A0AAV8DND8_9POAL|nr:transmembrane protein [Rhynchospora pubera]